MTAPDQRTSGFDANARGLAVLAVAVVVGLLLLWNAGDGGSGASLEAAGPGATVSTIDISGIGGDDTNGDDDPATTTTPDDTTTSSIAETGDTRPPAEVKVLVLNGGGPVGTAAAATSSIGEKGFVMQQATNASTQVATTVVYFADGYQADAEAVAAVLGKSPDAVEPIPSTSPGPGAESANVVVVLGRDTPPVSTGN